MSFEDDEYWDEEYAERSAMPRGADSRRSAPDPVIPTRRPVRPDPTPPTRPPGPIDELAARRQRRATGATPPAGRPQAAFDAVRPHWLDDPGFVPIDTSAPDLAGAEIHRIDLNRPELGADFGDPGYPGAAPVPDDRFDHVDQPYDHRQRGGSGRVGWSGPHDGAAGGDPRGLRRPAADGREAPEHAYRQAQRGPYQRPDERPGHPYGWHGPRAAHVVASDTAGTWSILPARPGPETTGPETTGPTATNERPAGAAGEDSRPYMDPDGTLHNLRPIARLALSGPDPAPHRPADTEFSGKWFAAGTPPPTGADGPANAEDGPGDGAPKDGPEETGRAEANALDLDAIRWRLDGATLREVVDDRDTLRQLGERLDVPLAAAADNTIKAGLLSLRAEVYRLLGEFGMAAAASRLALAHAESVTDPQATVIAMAELAHVLRLRGDFTEADRLFTKALGTPVPDPVRSVVHENAGRSCFDQGRHMEALDHFSRAVRLGGADDTELAERIEVCLQAVYVHVLRDGWGPYPRAPEEILR